MGQEEQYLKIQTEEDQKEDGNIGHQLMQKVGNQGRYQFISFALMLLLGGMAGSMPLLTPFLYFQDPYLCSDGSSVKECKNRVCSLTPDQRIPYIPQPSIFSIANQYGDYRCPSQNSDLTLVKTVMYSGDLLGVLIMSIVGGLISRKNLMIMSQTVTLLGLFLTILSTSLWMAGIGMFFCILAVKIILNLCFTFTIQTVSAKYNQGFIILIAISGSSVELINILWFYLIADYRPIFLYFYVVPTLIATAFFIYFVQDTPFSLIASNSPKQISKSLNFIAKVNQENVSISEQEAQILQLQYKKSLQTNSKRNFSIIDLFRYKSLRRMTILLALLDIIIVLQFFTPTLLLDQFNFSIFINGIAVQLSQIISAVPSYLFITRLPRRILAIYSFLIVGICSIVMIFIWDQDKSDISDIGANIAVLIFVFIIELAITSQYDYFVVYINQLYPAQVRLIGIGFIKSFGGGILMLSSLIIDLCLNSGFKIMILFTILASIALVTSFMLPQSFKKIPLDIIEELQINQDETPNKINRITS